MGTDRSRQGAQSRGEVTAGERKFQFYGRRKGHSLRRHHLQLMETLLPRLRFDPAGFRPDTFQACYLEIGFGGGEHLAHQASLHPDIRFVGAEPFINGVAKLLALIEEKGLQNVRVFDNDVRPLFAALPDASFSRIYLLYPDPWPKVRHHKRRFVSQENLAQIHRLLGPEGQFVFASDITDYADWALDHVRQHGGFTMPDGDDSVPPADWLETRYEEKAKAAGRRSRYLIFPKKTKREM